ncbi:MAG: DUF4476 domain-containing protein [Thermonemataceae bacterium]|nr:DUF4476 domain-containing protein [Thermonemataceae bacterium]
MKQSIYLTFFVLLTACQGNVSMQSESHSRTENKTSIKSQTITNGDTSSTDYEKKEQSFSESEDNKNIDFNVEDKTGISDELRKKLKRENDSLGKNKDDDNDFFDKPKEQEKKPTALKEKIQCETAISGDELTNLKETLAEERMDAARLKKLKNLFNSRCLYTKQARNVVSIFKMENNKLEAAKFLYGRTIDKNNFMQVAEEFNFSDSKEKLRSYIE